MKVRELLEALEKYPPEWEVQVTLKGRCSAIQELNTCIDLDTNIPCVVINGEYR